MARNKVNTIYTEGEQKKRYPILTALIIILVIAAIVLLSVFLVSYFGEEHLVSKMGGAQLVNTRKNVTYTLLMPCPYWVNLDIGDVYAECDGVKYYKIVYNDTTGKKQHFDPLKMIASADEDKIVSLYVAKGFSLPTLEEMAPDAAFVYYVRTVESRGPVLNQEETNVILDVLKNGKESIFPSNIDSTSVMNIYLASKNHLYTRYLVKYFETEDGEKYLQDTATGKCIKATSQLNTIFEKSESN